MGKLTFQELDLEKKTRGDVFEVQFNPTELTFEKSASLGEVSIPGLDSPILQFVRGESEKLTLELFFDGTENQAKSGLPGNLGAGADSDAAKKPKTVVQRVNDFYRLVKIDGKLHAPPLVRVGWGDAFPGSLVFASNAPTSVFDAVVETIHRRYTLFDPTGLPLRCIVGLTLREYRLLSEQVKEPNRQTSDHTRTHTVREGDTLPQIAHLAYQDSAHWRIIADANRIADPTALTPGQALDLPPLV